MKWKQAAQSFNVIGFYNNNSRNFGNFFILRDRNQSEKRRYATGKARMLRGLHTLIFLRGLVLREAFSLALANWSN